MIAAAEKAAVFFLPGFQLIQTLGDLRCKRIAAVACLRFSMVLGRQGLHLADGMLHIDHTVTDGTPAKAEELGLSHAVIDREREAQLKPVAAYDL